MSFRGKRELLVQVARRYGAARHGQRSGIRDEFLALTGYECKCASRLLLGPIRLPEPIGGSGHPSHGAEVRQALTIASSAPNAIWGKRLVPFLPEFGRAWAPTSQRSAAAEQ